MSPELKTNYDQREAEFVKAERVRRQHKIWAEGYNVGRKEEREFWQHRRWPDLIFAFIVGGIAGLVIAALARAIG